MSLDGGIKIADGCIFTYKNTIGLHTAIGGTRRRRGGGGDGGRRYQTEAVSFVTTKWF